MENRRGEQPPSFAQRNGVDSDRDAVRCEELERLLATLEGAEDPGLDAAERRRVFLHPPTLFPVTLSRLTDGEWSELRRFCTPISPFSGEALDRPLPRHDRLLLPKVLLAAEALFGESSSHDPYKGSFYFPLLLSGTRDDSPIDYGVSLCDIRGSVTVHFRRVGEREVEDPSWYRPPVDSELPRRDLDILGTYLVDFLLRSGEDVAAAAPPFVRVVDSELLVYGKCGGALFVRRFENESDFEGLTDELEQCASRRELEDLLAGFGGREARHPWPSSPLRHSGGR